jgi:hypothetical protein
MGMRSNALRMSSTIPIDPSQVEALNGRVQVSPGRAHIGLLTERGSLFCGVLLTPSQAKELASVLLDCSRLSEADDT